MTFSTFLRPARLAASVAFLLASAALSPVQAALITYDFYGLCGDCLFDPLTGTYGTARATLVLQNYTPGNVISSPTQFVSFTYHPTDLIPGGFTINGGDPGLVFSGELPATSGSAPSFYLANSFRYFAAYTYIDEETGQPVSYWETALAGGPNSDFGSNQQFLVTETPEPASFLLIGGGLASLVALRRRKR